MPDRWDSIEAMLADRIGLDPAAVGPTVITRAVKARMSELGLLDADRYTGLLFHSEIEIQALIEEVVVPESWFFRDEAPFRYFQTHVRSRWLTGSMQSPLRVLSIPCAGGEEPYSIVIALTELGLAPRRYQVTAVDVSARRLEIAKRGLFSRNAFRGRDLTFRDRYFRKQGMEFEFDPVLRAQVRFLTVSLLDLNLFWDAPPFDVVLCRNLLIYLDEPARMRAMAVIDRLLAKEGLLIIGHADRLSGNRGDSIFLPTGDRGAFSYRKTTAHAPARREPEVSDVPRAWPIPQLPSPRPRMLLTWQPRQAPDITAGSDLPKANGSRPRESQGLPPSQSGLEGKVLQSLLDQAQELANLRRYDAAVELCNQSLRQHGPSASAYYLMGVIYLCLEDRAKSDECFQKTVYLDPTHDEALLALALSAERRGDVAAAAGFRRRANRAVLKKGAQ